VAGDGWLWRLVLIAAAAAIMGVVLYTLRAWTAIYLLNDFAAVTITLIGLIVIGLAVYLALLRLFGVFDVNDLLRQLRQRD
jgi:peptidoglycan biosynthesis protein MviN/MurJ (putative lipid II flippase)